MGGRVIVVNYHMLWYDDNGPGMTCFINSDYKYVHISFIASIHGFGLCVSSGQEEFPQIIKKSKRQGRSALFPYTRRTRVPRAHCYHCFLLSQGVTVEACSLDHPLPPPREDGVPFMSRCKFTSLLSLFPHTQPFPNHGPWGGGGWEWAW